MFSKAKSFINDVKGVIKEVTWPKRETLIQLTIMVIFISVLTGAILGAADFLFTKLVSWATLR